MNDFVTVFEISGGGIAGILRIAAGFAAIALALFIFFSRRNSEPERRASIVFPIFFAGWGAALLIMQLPLAFEDSPLRVYLAGKSDVTEGPVKVLRLGRRGRGNISSDLISIGDHEFEIGSTAYGPGYVKTIRHGGVLRAGAYVRVHYYNGIILKIETKIEKAGATVGDDRQQAAPR